MTSARTRTYATSSAISISLPIVLICILVGAIALQGGLISFSAPLVAAPRTVTIPAGAFEYRGAGEFYRDGLAVDGPTTVEIVASPITIMKYQVSTADYDQCAAEGVCPTRESMTPSRPDLPATRVSFDDAVIFAHWLSEQTHQVWRLPTDRELAYSAASKFPDDALGIDPDTRNPALRWLADYERESARKASREPEPQSYGYFGENEYGLADFGGNVWEWTSTCNRRVDLDPGGHATRQSESCGVYIADGKHRAPLSSFVREPKTGGCSVGTPPDNVGFRLVRDSRWYAPLLFAIQR